MAAPTASVGLNSQKITGLANGTLSTDAAAFGQIPTTIKGTEITVTPANTWQTIATFTPATTAYIKCQVYITVPGGGANVGIQATYADASGAETLTILPVQAQASGPWSSLTALIAAHSGTAVNLQVQSSSTSTVASGILVII
jgi:hypothetical protein